MLRVPPPPDFVPFERAALEQSLADRFEQQARRAPGRTAIAARAQSLTYAQLNARANGIAARLLTTSPRRDLPVCVLVGHGALQAAAILGVLKAGRAYVGIDPLHEPEAHRRTLAHCGADVVVCEAGSRALAARLATPGVHVLDLDGPEAAPREDDPPVARSPDDAAYIYYTSGTTGVPKGVLDNQRNVLHNVMRYTNHLGIAPSDRLSLLQSVAFSGAVSSLFAALLNGATSLPADLRADGVAGAAEWLESQGVTIYHSVPSIFERLAGTGRRFPSLRIVRLEGDLATPRHLALFQQHCGAGVTLVNGLGATETGISHQFVCGHDSRLAGNVLPVGLPCQDVQGFVVDAAGEVLPPGSVGEVVVRSRYLALGYWRQPELTAARFGEDPSGRGERTYRTGDLGRYTSGGVLELLGRSDRAHKLHGRWVDLQSVEAGLMRVPGVRDAVAVVRESRAGGSELVAYLVPREGGTRPGPAVLRAALAALPDEPAVPARHVWLEALPLDANGKVARHALPDPPRERPPVTSAWAAPAGATEEALARLWAEVLGLDAVGVHDDFAELGGGSLQAIDIVTRAEALFGLRRGAPRLLEASTVAGMARRIDELRAAHGDTAAPGG